MKSERISKPASTSPKTPAKDTQAHKPLRRKRKNKELPLLPPPVVSRQGKTTVSRYSNRTFYRMEEIKGKTVDFVELFTSFGHHSIQIRLQDKTSFYFTIHPGFTIDREYGDIKTGNWQNLKQWPLVRSQINRR